MRLPLPIEHTEAPLWRCRWPLALAGAVLFVAGLLLGAFAFGELLMRSERKPAQPPVIFVLNPK